MKHVTIYQRKTTTSWYLRYRDQNGDLKRLSTKTSDKQKALLIAADLEKHLFGKVTSGLESVGFTAGVPTWDGYYEKIDMLTQATVAASKKRCAREVKLAQQHQALLRELVLRIENAPQSGVVKKTPTSDH